MDVESNHQSNLITTEQSNSADTINSTTTAIEMNYSNKDKEEQEEVEERDEQEGSSSGEESDTNTLKEDSTHHQYFSSNNNNRNRSNSTILLPPSETSYSKGLKLISLLGLVGFSSLYNWKIELSSLQNKNLILFSLSLDYFIFILIYYSLNQFGILNKFNLNRNYSYLSLSNSHDGIWKNLISLEGEKKLIKLLSILSILVGLLSFWSNRYIDTRLVQSLDVFIIPLLFLLPPFILPLLNLSSSITLSKNQTSSNHYLIAISITFLIGFSLVGIPSSTVSGTGGSILLLSLIKILFEGLKWILFKYLLTILEKPGNSLFEIYLWSFNISLFILIFSSIFISDKQSITSNEIYIVLIQSIYSILNQFLLLINLYLFDNPLTIAFTLLPRNLILLLSKRSYELEVVEGGEGNYQQMLLVVSIGTIALILTDPELNDLIPEWKTISSTLFNGRIGSRMYSFLPSFLKPLGTTPPSSPSRSSRRSNSFSNHHQYNHNQHQYNSNHNSNCNSNSNSNNHTSNSNNNNNNSNHQQNQFKISLPLSLLPFLPLLYFLLQSSSSSTQSSSSTLTPSPHIACSYLPLHLQSTFCTPPPSLLPPSKPTVDLVFSYYDESLITFKAHIDRIKNLNFVKQRKDGGNIWVYNKGLKTENELREFLGLRDGIDRVIQLENVGREGGTYLTHILTHYNASLPTFNLTLPPSSIPTSTSKLELYQNQHNLQFQLLQQQQQQQKEIEIRLEEIGLADHTFFLQFHLAWEEIALARLKLLDDNTGFAHFGPYLRSDCGIDGRGRGIFPLVKEFYNIITESICPPTNQLSAWSAQFIVSKKRILFNPYSKYQTFSNILSAPQSHWLHSIWGPNQSKSPSNPASGHSLERSWPIIFNCNNLKIADECTDDYRGDDRSLCQCLDF